MPRPPLTPRQLLFARTYAVTGNAQQSAITAGYAVSSARIMAGYLLRQAHVADTVTDYRMTLLRERDVTHARITEEYRRLAFSDARTLHRPDGTMKPPQEWDDETASTIAGIEVTRRRTDVGYEPSSPAPQGTGVMPTAGTDIAPGTLVRTEESVLKVKRYDKLKALDRLAEMTGLIGGGGTGPGTGTGSTVPSGVDLEALTRMTEEELQLSIASAKRLLGQ